jgi:hypothetical protein
MKIKHAAAAALLLGAGIAPPALATTVAKRTIYTGKVAQGGTVEIVAAAVHGKVTKIALELNHVRATCKEGSVSVTFFAHDEPVRHGAFYVKGHHMLFKGQFPRTYQSVRGTASLSGDLARYSNCTTGTVHWSAKAVHR